ncbi:hypothetical protein A2U01_0068583, partial [Trifolium medium]|nr:hypothetical protein [Trifolium medium]
MVKSKNDVKMHTFDLLTV